MKTVEVSASKRYDVLICPGVLRQAGERIRPLVPRAVKAAVMTDDTVAALYADALEASLRAAGLETLRCTVPHGEESKNGATYLSILNFLAAGELTRSDVLVALGGGMVGDMAGFAAATYLRGIAYVQVPTTLLAMVDSSVGGKTAIDLEQGKNLAGAFCQPEIVLCDCDTLDTLPRDILRDGCAEVVKYGVLGDRALFDHMLSRGLDFDREEVIFRSVSMKRDYVCADEFDTGLRRKLNLGHTLGHAVEKRSDFALSHGKSVAIGLACVARASAARGLCSAACAGEIEKALTALGLPVRTDYGIDELMPAMLSDKKRSGATVSVITPEEVGRCGILPLGVEELKKFMKAGL